MARDDWRIRIDVDEEEHAAGLLDRLGLELGGEARELAAELRERRLAVSRDGNTGFVYASTRSCSSAGTRRGRCGSRAARTRRRASSPTGSRPRATASSGGGST